jgi:hypothetical protein
VPAPDRPEAAVPNGVHKGRNAVADGHPGRLDAEAFLVGA